MTVAPWPHWTSSAKISSSGFAEKSASSDSSKRVAGHLRVGLLRIRRNPDLALEHALGAVEQNVADHFRRRRVRHVVTEREGHVGMRVAAQQIDAAQLEVGAFAGHHAMNFLAHQLAAGIDDEQRQLRIRAEIEH